ncbi:hypothetical protein B0H13DRAFT_1901685 [Mycena leptocephala]|nr:hypothetical protein B0H13DRAFT_1901685 [Mycena leptocephala]
MTRISRTSPGPRTRVTRYYTGFAQFVFKSQLFFSTTALAPSANHTVSWVLHATETNGTTGLFDYAVITVVESTVAPSVVISPVLFVGTRRNAQATSTGVNHCLVILHFAARAAVNFWVRTEYCGVECAGRRVISGCDPKMGG